MKRREIPDLLEGGTVKYSSQKPPMSRPPDRCHALPLQKTLAHLVVQHRQRINKLLFPPESSAIRQESWETLFIQVFEGVKEAASDKHKAMGNEKNSLA